jgi:hypothetical protein
MFGDQLNQRGGIVQRPFPVLGFGVYLAANLKNGWVSAIFCRDLLQFFVDFLVIAQFNPAFNGFQMALILNSKRLDHVVGPGRGCVCALAIPPRACFF